MNLFDSLCDFETIDRAARAMARGKRRRPDVATFLFVRERVIEEIVQRLAGETWRPDGFRLHFIRDPKPRVVAASTVADRIVHAALIDLAAPILDRYLSGGDFACRKGFGTHRAVVRLLEYMRRGRFVCHLDVRAYFPSVNIDILEEILRRRLRDRRFMSVIRAVLDDGRGIYDRPGVRRYLGLDQDWPPKGQGLPVGALTSQYFASHVYLAEFDQFVLRRLRVHGYVRYVDDIFIFGRGRAEVRAWRNAIGTHLEEERHLRLKSPQAPILSCLGTLDALGHRITRAGCTVQPGVGRRFRAAIRRHVYRLGRERRGPDLGALAASYVGLMTGI